MTARLPLLLCLAAFTACADQTLPVLVTKGQTYSNVTVTAVTPADVFFQYAGGMGNAKLKDLDPKLQAYFHYDAAKGKQLEQQQATNNALFHLFVSTNQPTDSEKNSAGNGDDFVAPQIFARSIRGGRPPQLAVEQWLTPKPDAAGKFVMIVFWMPSSDSCRQTIPQLNSFFEKYHDRLVIIGISNEPEDAVRKMTGTPIEFAVAVDTQAHMAQALEITGVPHCILVDPHATVRYEGMPGYLDDAKLEHFLTKYQ